MLCASVSVYANIYYGLNKCQSDTCINNNTCTSAVICTSSNSNHSYQTCKHVSMLWCSCAHSTRDMHANDMNVHMRMCEFVYSSHLLCVCVCVCVCVYVFTANHTPEATCELDSYVIQGFTDTATVYYCLLTPRCWGQWTRLPAASSACCRKDKEFCGEVRYFSTYSWIF